MSGRARHVAALIAAGTLIALVIWIDVTTSIWQEMVIISGLAAGVVTFLLTTLFIDRFLERSAERRWAPVTRLALTEILHELADEERSELSRGQLVPRRLPVPETTASPDELRQTADLLRAAVVCERSHLATTLGVWSQFLVASGGNEMIMRHVADATLHLDNVRDASLELDAVLDRTGGRAAAGDVQGALASLRGRVEECNAAIAGIAVEVAARLAQEAAEQGTPVARLLVPD